MSNYRRARDAGALYFFTLVTNQRLPLLTRPDVRQQLRAAIVHTRACYPFVIHGWVLLPDHLHCIWELPGEDHDFGRRWSIIKRRVSQNCAGPRLLSRSRQSRSSMVWWTG